MKLTLFLGILVFTMNLGFTQDSLLITNHYAIYEEIECCKRSKNQLKCIDSLIAANQMLKRSGNPAHQFIKQRKAFVIYHINAGGIYRRRGNYSEAETQFKIAEKYADSLKNWTKNNQDIEQIMATLQYSKEQWCFDLYTSESIAFYTCDCAKFFPELNEKDSVTEEIEHWDTLKMSPTLVRTVPVNLYGKFYLNDTLRIDPRFVCDSLSINYFNKNQSHILANLANYPFSEIMREMSAKTDKPDTVIIRIELTREENQITKKCSTVYSTCPEYLSDWYLYFFSNHSFNYPYESISFYVPIVLKSKEPDLYFNLNQISLGDDHYSIEIEKISPLNPK